MAENKLFEILAKFTKREDGVDHAARSMSLNIMVSTSQHSSSSSSCYPATNQPHSIPKSLHYKSSKKNIGKIQVVSLAAACAGAEVVKLYRHVCEGLPLEEQKLVQRRIKEALIRTGHLYGTPKVIQALFPLFQDLKDEEIDQYGPR